MNNLYMAWQLLSLPVFILGCGLFYDHGKGTSRGMAVVASVLFFLPIWWALYYIIKALVW